MQRPVSRRTWDRATALSVRWVLALVLVLLASWPARAQDPDTANAPRIPMAEFKTLHETGKVLVIDTRGAEAFAAGHIPGAINMPLPAFSDSGRIAELKAEARPIVIYCA